MVSHPNPTTTAYQIPAMPMRDIIPPKNPTSTLSPLNSESPASGDIFCRQKHHAATSPLIPSAAKPNPPAAKWIRPVVLIDVGGPFGVPGGNPSTGSAERIAAVIMARP